MDYNNNYDNNNEYFEKQYFEKQRFEEQRREEEEREEENKRIENEKQRYEEEGIEYEKQEEEKQRKEENYEKQQAGTNTKENAEKEEKQQFPNSDRSSFAPDKSDFFNVNFARYTRKKKEAVPGKTTGGDAAVVGIIAVIFIFAQAMSWLAVVAGIGGGILAVLSWQKGYRAFRLYAAFALNAGGIIGGLIAYFSYLF